MYAFFMVKSVHGSDLSPFTVYAPDRILREMWGESVPTAAFGALTGMKGCIPASDESRTDVESASYVSRGAHSEDISHF